jgi:hypothetical protein
MALASSFTSLRRTPHRPDPASTVMFNANGGPATGVGWPMERSKGGETVRSSVSGDMSAIGRPASVARASSLAWAQW